MARTPASATPAQKLRKDLERFAWSSKHRDYKSIINGKRYVLIYRTGKGTCLEPIESISNDDLISMLPSSSQAEFRR